MSGSASGTSERVRELLAEHGTTYAEEAGIRLADKPAPLYELLVLATLLSARIAAGYRTPAAMAGASRQGRVDALGRGHYKRYDERTATMLGDGAGQVLRDWHGDLRALRDKAGGGAAAIVGLLTEFPGTGPAGALAELLEESGQPARLAAALIRMSLKGRTG
jgi:hypothetical protein